jgi:hypothetical protein
MFAKLTSIPVVRQKYLALGAGATPSVAPVHANDNHISRRGRPVLTCRWVPSAAGSLECRWQAISDEATVPAEPVESSSVA